MKPSPTLIARLSRIEGQVAALKQSLKDDALADCAQTLYQVKASIQGLKSFGEAFSRDQAKNCLGAQKSNARLVRELDTIINSAFTLS